MPAKTFEQRFTPDWPVFVVLRYVILAALAVHVTLATISGYRAWVQVKKIEIHLRGPVIERGSTIQLDVVTSGRVTNEVLLELVQEEKIVNRMERVEGEQAWILARYEVPENENFFYDPRSRHRTFTRIVDSADLARMRDGPGLVRPSRSDVRSFCEYHHQ